MLDAYSPSVADGRSKLRPFEKKLLTASSHGSQVSKAPTAQSNSPRSLFTQTHPAEQTALPLAGGREEEEEVVVVTAFFRFLMNPKAGFRGHVWSTEGFRGSSR